ncbi:uncharacterized protein JCM6883_005298 [Sporobolomyces salmoneus]|uniref:uncharacterized protein n=1 Tax=Sporobolomyces salmoneus TaxID=183962 RepID=UPI0031720835
MAENLEGGIKLFPRHDKSTFTPAEMAEMLVDPYEDTPKYAKAALIFLCAGIAILGIFNFFSIAVRNKRITRSKGYRRAVAFYRWVESSQPKAIGWIRFPTVGVILLITVFWLFIGIWTFAQTPYYRSRWNVGSPPLAMRTGLFAVALFPFIFAFGAKWNIVGFIAGCSHEKLQVFHQWLSHLFLILSLLHTFPFVVQGTHEIRPNLDGLNPHGYSQLYYSWHVSHKVYYWSGIAALVPLAWLCWGSFTPIRNASYEIFKWMHIVSAILFSAFFYIHCNNLLTSWHYIFAAAAVYLTSVVVRFGLLFARNGRKIARGHVDALPDNAVRVTVTLPRGAGHRWTAGQHYFVNFFSVRPLESHPYTIANAPYTDPSSSAAPDRLVLLFRVNPSKGLGPRLLNLASTSHRSTPVLLDGPYGGLASQSRDFGRHSSLILIAGGAGVTLSTSIIEEICMRVRRKEEGVRTKSIELFWAVKNEDAKTWVEEQLASIAEQMPQGFFTFRLFVTEHSLVEKADKLEAELDSANNSLSSPKSRIPWIVENGRPSFSSLLERRFDAAHSCSSIGIASCGPSSLTTDVRRVVAARQKQIAFGLNSGKGVAEIELHTEEFDW